ncbi:MAG TPA: hypothetical protein VNR88_00505 [Hyphomicrobium sp.]|nr:hypothetical protein [Hyphomicrobium sp.]
MNDHFWPSLYPGIIVALIIGFATGGIFAIVTGAVGGLIGSVAAYFFTAWLGLEESVVSLIILIIGASAGGYAGAQAGVRLECFRKSGNRFSD